MPLLLLLIPVLGVLVLEIIFIYKATANKKRAKLLACTPITKVAALGQGPAKVQGRIVIFDKPLPGPLSGRPCVYYQFQVEEKKTRHGPPPHGGGGSFWKTVVNDIQTIPCGLDDGTGIAGLDLRGAEMVLSVGAQMRSGFFKDAPPELERLLKERYGRSSKGLIFNKGMRYTETLLEDDDPVLVLGAAEHTPKGNYQFSKGDGPFIVSNKSEGVLLSSYKKFAVLWLTLAILAPAVACVLLGLLAI